MQSVNPLPDPSGGLRPLFALGHSILDFGQFAKLPADRGIELLADVRGGTPAGVY